MQACVVTDGARASLVCCSLPPCSRLCCERAYVPVPMASEDGRALAEPLPKMDAVLPVPRTALQYLLLCYYLLFKVLQAISRTGCMSTCVFWCG